MDLNTCAILKYSSLLFNLNDLILFYFIWCLIISLIFYFELSLPIIKILSDTERQLEVNIYA